MENTDKCGLSKEKILNLIMKGIVKMDEIIKIESVDKYKKGVKTFLVVCIILTVIAFIIGAIFGAWSSTLSDKIWRSSYSVQKELEMWEQYGNTLSIANDIENAGFVIGVILAAISILTLTFYLYSSKMQLIVTDKRVYGKTAFGKQVDLPLDSISAVGTSMLKGITVATSSGKIKFLGISNRDDIHKVISQLLIERQNKKEATPVTHVTQQAQSSADELKKYKELLDNDIISQEEFDAKKKQLLGL